MLHLLDRLADAELGYIHPSGTCERCMHSLDYGPFDLVIISACLTLQVVSKSPEPTFDNPPPPPPRRSSISDDIGRGEYRPPSSKRTTKLSKKSVEGDSAHHPSVSAPAAAHLKSPTASPDLANAGVLDTLPAPISGAHDLEAGSRSQNANPTPLFSRRPPTTPVLLPAYRYCYRDTLYKPLRAHHCRACGTVCLLANYYP